MSYGARQALQASAVEVQEKEWAPNLAGSPWSLEEMDFVTDKAVHRAMVWPNLVLVVTRGCF